MGSLAAAAGMALAVLSTQGIAAQAAEIKIIAGTVMTPVFGELGPEFERATGHKLVIKYGVTGEMKRQIEGGEAFDLAIVSSALLDDLIKQGKIAADSRTPFARVGMGVGVRAGGPKPDVNSLDAFKRALLNAKSVTYAPEGATGIQLAKVMEQLGITEQMKAKTKPQTDPVNIAKAVAAGDAELGFALTSILLSVPGVELAGLFPAELQNWFVNTAGVSTAAKQPDAAKAMIKHLTTPAAAAVIKAKGMEPLSK
jgi:molybdate transport system substrate-binding protein